MSAGQIYRRRYGATSVELSVLGFGTMRLLPERTDPDTASSLLLKLHAAGVTTLHSSSEYPGYALFCDALQRARRRHPGADFEHVCKIAVPHFDEQRFSTARLVAAVDTELRKLGIARVDVLQWMVRHTPNEDEPRLRILRDQLDEIRACFDDLRAAGKVAAIAVFPYSAAFAEAVIAAGFGDGLIDYWNPLETVPSGWFDRLQATQRGFIGIRPLGGTDAPVLFARSRPGAASVRVLAAALDFALSHPAVACTLWGSADAARVDAMLEAAGGLQDRHGIPSDAAARRDGPVHE
ncbi:MAG TPA: aldo/keto reductase [Gammaproteobacteria bacterium]|nr:aldo/keto reductase [Gammaproteobacteria bacterium]